MRVEVVGRDIEVGSEAEARCNEKGEKLTKYFDRTQQVTFTLSRDGDQEFHAECIVDVESHDDFVSHGKAGTLLAAIDEASQKAARQLTDFKTRVKTNKR